MGKNKHGVCQRCGHERALEADARQCRACGRAERAKKPKPKPRPAEPDKRVIWPPEKCSWGRCPECATCVVLRADGKTVKHRHCDSEKWDGIGPCCTGSDQLPTELVETPIRRVRVPDQPKRVPDHEFLPGNEIPAGLPGHGQNRRH